MSGIVDYKTAVNIPSDRPSPIIWADCPVITMLRDPGKGFHVFEDFHYLNCDDATTIIGHRFYPYLDTCTLAILADNEKGILNMDLGDTENDAAVITTGDNVTGCITPADGSKLKWWFECRIAVGSITNGDQALFVGLAQEGQAADSKPLADTTLAVGDIDHVGFHVDGADGDGVNFVWNLNGQDAQVTADVYTFTAVDTYVNLGFKYDPNDNKVHVYVNGVENKSAAFLMSHASAPDDCLAVVLAVKADGGTPDNMLVDWVRYAAEYRV